MLKILFAGNPSIGVNSLIEISKHFDVVAVLTNPDRAKGRGRILEAPPIKVAAQQLGIPVLQYDRLLSESREEVKNLGANFLVSFASGHYFGPKFLQLFDKGAINVHPSLLPLYRGPSPIQFALLDGVSETGITIQRLAKEIDSGNILSQIKFNLDGDETAFTLEEKVASLAPKQLVDTLNSIVEGTVEEIEQDHSKATFTRMLTKEDGIIDWSNSAKTIHCQIRALAKWPKAYTTYKDTTLLITKVAGKVGDALDEERPPCIIPGSVLHYKKQKGIAITCNDAILYVERLQLAQKKELDSASFLNGNKNFIGSFLGG